LVAAGRGTGAPLETLRELLAELPHQSEPSLVLAELSAPKLFRKTGARVTAEPPARPGSTWHMCWSVDGRSFRLAIDDDPTELCRALSEEVETISEADFANAVPEANPDGLKALIATLIEHGVLEPIG